MNSSLGNLWRRRHLLQVIVISNVKRQNKNSVLGYLWWLLDPILMTAVYYLIVAIFFQRGGSQQPYLLFLLCGLVAWKAFADSVSQSTQSIWGSAAIVKAIGFPKAVLPISLVFSNAIFFLFALIIVMVLAWCYGLPPNIYYLMFPVVLGLQCLFTIGVSLFVSTIGVFFRDTTNIVGHLLRVWYFLSPGMYEVDRIPDKWQTWFRLNPFCEFMTSYRDIVWGKMPSFLDLSYSLGIGLVSFGIGYAIFRRYESRFVQKL